MTRTEVTVAPAPTADTLASALLDARVRRAAANATVEILEDRRLMAGDSSVVSSLPFSLEFDTDRGGMADKNGTGTGFTWVQPNKLGNEYQPGNINLNTASGILYLTTTGTSAAGGPWESDNTLTNSLQTQFNASTGSFTIRTRLVGPLGYIDAASEQGGIVFGPDQDNYVKLVAVAQPGGTFLQFIDEQKTGTSFTHQVSSSASLVNIGSFANINTLDLELVGDAATGKVQAFYRVNGGLLTKLTQEITLAGSSKANFFSSTAKAGLIAMHKNDGGPITVGFDRFEIQSGNPATTRPTVTATRPAPGATNVARDIFVAADVNLPSAGHGVDAASLTSSTVRLYRTSDHKLIDAHLNTTGGGDAIVCQPSALLDANTSYTFEVTDGVKDTSGAAFLPFVMTFTTGTQSTQGDARIAFEKVALSNATGTQYSGLTIGPDGKLYAATSTGVIHRFTINPDGTLGVPQVITTVQTNNAGNRFITGIVFDPSSTASNLVLFISHNYSALENAPDWTGKISRLSGADLGTYQDYVTGLPRSVRDHLTNQMAFGPDGKLYISQGSMSAMGAPDNAWGLRAEHLLSGAVLKLDTAAVAARIAAGQGALNVQTEATANPYNPFAANAPLKIYATGVRNAYDLVWHSNGHLYAPTNGSAAGGATPGYAGGTFNGTRIDSDVNGPFSSPAIPGIGNVKQTEDDFLHDVVEGGYYGHPNPLRGEFVQDGGNPTAGVDFEEFTQYPVGTQPDRNYRGAAFVFGKNYSPNGVIEYKSDAFGGLLKGKLLVVRYSGGDDIVAIDVNGDGSVGGLQSGLTGLGGLVDPLDLVADNASGNIYVSEYGASKITLLRPTSAGGHATVSKPTLYFNDVRGGANSPTQTITIKNTGSGDLSITSLTLTGTNANQFVIVTKPNMPATIPVGGSVTVGVAFAANSTTALGIKTAQLSIATNDGSKPVVNVDLRGLATIGEGGQNEPSLQRVLDLFQIPINTGDINPSNTNLYSTAEPLSSVNDLVNLQRFVKAGNGPVTIETLATFGGGTPVVRFGYYQPGTPTSMTQLFTVGKADAQSVNPTPVGNTSFDPGSNPFGLYTVWPVFNNRIAYSEDSLNTTENTVANRKKMLAFALKNPDGSVVPNAYVLTFEDFVNDPTGGYDINDCVVIIRNVQAAPAGAEIGLQNMDGVPSNDRMIFSRIQVQPPLPVKQADGSFVQPPNNVVHDRGVMRIFNTGSSDLVVSNIQITGAFALAAGTPTSFTITPGTSVDLTVIFSAQSGGVQEGSLKVFSNDADEPVSTMQLAGMWQSYSEQGPGGQVTEHPLSEFFRLFGYSTKATYAGQNLSNGGRNEAVGDEVLSAYWQAADPTAPVKVTQLAAYHTQGNTEVIKTFLKSNPNSQSTLFTHEGLMGQSILPTLQGSTTALAQAALPSAVANTVFGFKVSSMWSDDTLTNQKDPVTGLSHFIRFYPAKDANGVAIPNTWLLAMDYYGINYDYQDNIYLIQNVRPANPGTPTGVAAESANGGIRVSWAANTEPTATNYNVYRSDSATGVFVKVNSGPVRATEFIDTTAPGNGAVSYYKVTAADDWGGESGQSAVVSAARAGDAVPPLVPQSVTGSNRVDGVLIGWASNIDADLMGYKVYRSLAADGVFTALNGGAVVSTNEFLDTDTVEGTTFFYKVSAVDTSNNESAMSAVVSGTRTPPPDTVAPNAPTGAGATGTKAGMQITWDANSETDLAGYRVFRSTSLNGTYSLLNTGALVTGTAFTDGSAAVMTSYYYRIVAVDKSGNASVASASASAQRPYADPVRVNAAGGSYVDAQGRTWAADNGFVGGTASTGAYEVLGTSDDPLYYTRRYGNFNYNLAVPDGAYKVNLYFADSSFTTAGKRKFDVFAENKQILDDFDIAANGGGKTAISKGFNVNVTGGELNLKFANVLDNAIVSAIEILPIGDTVAPSIPKKPAATGGQDGIKLDWQDNVESDLAGYNVYRSDDVEGTYTKVNGTDLVTVSEYLDATAPAGTASYYRITAVDIYGNESSPLSVAGTRPGDTTPPATPANLNAAGSQAGGVALTWSANVEADLAGYNVYRQDPASGQFVKLNAALLGTAGYTDSAAAYDATSAYRVTAVDKTGNESAFATASAYRPAAPVNGLKGEYFDNADFTNPKLTRIDAGVNFDWGQGSPDASMGNDSYSVRWTGQIVTPTTQTYTFTLRSDDGVRLWVNGQLIIDKFVNAGANKDNVSTGIKLTAGVKYDIKIEYFENTGGAFCQLYWQTSTMPKTLVPASALFAPAT